MELNLSSWSEYKELLTRKNPNWQHIEHSASYYLFFFDGQTQYSYVMSKDGGADQGDWEDNYKSQSNYAIGQRPYSFATSDFKFKGDGVTFTATANGSSQADFKILTAGEPGLYVNGGDLFTAGSKVGDYVKFQVVDVDNILGYGAGFVVEEWISKWFVNPSGAQSVATPYAGKIPGGLYLRMIYQNTNASTDVSVAVNYYLHKPI